jgi:DNA helicase II / ATP-dependent DNA helicase PcrA
LKSYYATRGDGRKQRQYLYELLGWISRRKRAISGTRSDDEDPDSGEDAELVYRDYNARLAAQAAIDFDDILLLAYRILTELPQVGRLYARMYRYLCVDEAQDLNEAQYALIRVLAADHGNILMVGDPNQAIYGFNGSSRRFMLEGFPEDFRVTRHELRENYRSAKAVIRAANALFAGSIDETLAPLNGLCEIQGLEHEEAEAEWIADKIQELLALGEHPEIDGRISLDRMAVLARNRYVFLPLESRLKADGIPHYLKRPRSADDLESDFGRAFDLGLRLLANPLDRLHRGQLCELLGADSTRCDDSQGALAQLRELAAQTDQTWRKDYAVLLSAWSELDADTNGFPNVVMRLNEHCSRSNSSDASDVERSAAQGLAVQAIVTEGTVLPSRCWETSFNGMPRSIQQQEWNENRIAGGVALC